MKVTVLYLTSILHPRHLRALNSQGFFKSKIENASDQLKHSIGEIKRDEKLAVVFEFYVKPITNE